MNIEKQYLRLIIDFFFTPVIGRNNFIKFIQNYPLNENELFRILEENQITFRFLSNFEIENKKYGCLFSENFLQLINQKNLARSLFIEHLKDISKIFSDYSINAIFLKIDKYPDFGKDIDIYVGHEYQKVINILIQRRWSKKRITSKIFNRPLLYKYGENYWPIDLYFKYSRFNENWFLYSNYLLKNKRQILIQDMEISIPSAENSLLIECISSTYLGGCINLGGILFAKTQIENHNFNFITFLNDVKKSNCCYGAHIFLHFLNSIFPINDISKILNEIPCPDYIMNMINKRFKNCQIPFYIPIHIQCYLYVNKLIQDIKKRRDFHSIFLLFSLYGNFRNTLIRRWNSK